MRTPSSIDERDGNEFSTKKIILLTNLVLHEYILLVNVNVSVYETGWLKHIMCIFMDREETIRGAMEPVKEV